MHPDLPPDPTSLWLRPERPRRPPLRGDATTRVAVVGGGMAGITTALLLARAGVPVTVLEARRVGEGTTGRTTGKVTALQGTRYHSIAAHHGVGATRAYADAQLHALDWLSGEVRSLGLEAAWDRRPAYTYAGTPEGRSSVEQEAEAASAAGLPVEVVDDAGLPYDHHGAVVLADQAQIDPVPYLLAAAEEIAGTPGCAVHEGTRVLAIRGRRRPTVVTEEGEVHADHVVVATLMPVTDRGAFFARGEPTGSYAVAVDVEGPLPTGMYLSADEPSRSLRTAAGDDGRELLVVGGGGHVVGRRTPTGTVQDELLTWARGRFDVRGVAARWFAHDVVPTDQLPWAGPVAPWSDVLVAGGFAKWGMTNAVAAAQVLTDHVLGRDDGPSAAWRSVYHPYHASPRGVLSTARLNAGVAVRLLGGWTMPERPPVGPGRAGAVRRSGAVPVGATPVDLPGATGGAGGDGSGATADLSVVCTHLGGVCTWNDAERTWDCPLHGSRFAADGSVVAGPATRPLSGHDRLAGDAATDS